MLWKYQCLGKAESFVKERRCNFHFIVRPVVYTEYITHHVLILLEYIIGKAGCKCQVSSFIDPLWIYQEKIRSPLFLPSPCVRHEVSGQLGLPSGLAPAAHDRSTI